MIVQNRDSQAFLYFFMIRDIEVWTTGKLRELFEQCTQDEIQRLLHFPFPTIYQDLYLKHDPVKYQRQEKQAFTNYRYFHSRDDLKLMAMMVRGQPIPWEFPKGRLDSVDEPPLQAGLRELMEETGILLRLVDPNHEMEFDPKDIDHPVHINGKPCAMMTFLKPKPFLRHQVTVRLYGVVLNNHHDHHHHPHKQSMEDDRIDNTIRYQNFPQAIRSISLSDECLHARWVTIREASRLLPYYLYNALVQWFECLKHDGYETPFIDAEIVMGQEEEDDGRKK